MSLEQTGRPYFFRILHTLVRISPGECQRSDNHSISRERTLGCASKAKWNDKEFPLGLWHHEGMTFWKSYKGQRKSYFMYLCFLSWIFLGRLRKLFCFVSLSLFLSLSLTLSSSANGVVTILKYRELLSRDMITDNPLLAVGLSLSWVDAGPHPLEWVSLRTKNKPLKQ